MKGRVADSCRCSTTRRHSVSTLQELWWISGEADCSAPNVTIGVNGPGRDTDQRASARHRCAHRSHRCAVTYPGIVVASEGPCTSPRRVPPTTFFSLNGVSPPSPTPSSFARSCRASRMFFGVRPAGTSRIICDLRPSGTSGIDTIRSRSNDWRSASSYSCCEVQSQQTLTTHICAFACASCGFSMDSCCPCFSCSSIGSPLIHSGPYRLVLPSTSVRWLHAVLHLSLSGP